MPYQVRVLAPLCCLALVLGCSEGVPPEEVPPLQPVSGKVTLDGQPAAGVSVSFTPTDGASGNGAYASTDESGSYTLQYRTGDPGIPAGEYAVTFIKMAQPDGSPIPEGQTAADVMAENVLPERYQRMPQRASVPEGGKTFDFDLQSK